LANTQNKILIEDIRFLILIDVHVHVALIHPNHEGTIQIALKMSKSLKEAERLAKFEVVECENVINPSCCKN